MKNNYYIWGVKALFTHNVDYTRSDSEGIISHYVNIASGGGEV
jgi:hypothetical protein